MLNLSNDAVAVKVCGVTTEADALACAATGADMLGLNFSPVSIRGISQNRARDIVKAVRSDSPATQLVGIFVDQEQDFVQTIARELELDAVQLHGNESPEYARTLRAPFIIKALRVRPGFAASDVSAYDCDAILLDSWSANAPGGTGITFPWSVATAVRPLVRHLILSGGLNVDNVTDAVRTVRPAAIDVCSGLEDSPGRKDSEKVRQFIQVVRAVEAVKV